MVITRQDIKRSFLSGKWRGVCRILQVVFALLLYVTTGCGRPPADIRVTPLVETVQKVAPSVVNIGTERIVKVVHHDPFSRFRGDLVDQFFHDFFGSARPRGYRVAHSLGSGVIIDELGYILTNYHVIERASEISVTLYDGLTYQARFIAGDELNDLALIKIEPDYPLKAVEFAADDDLLPAETVVVLGNPLGLANTVTVGVLSAINREARYNDRVLFSDILQTDAAVNPGNSGGPMLNIKGELIGINVAFNKEAENIGFAIPVKRVRALLGHWLEPSNLKNLWLGVRFYQSERGLVAGPFEEGEPTSSSALVAGDRLLSVNDHAVSNYYDLGRILLPYFEGDSVPVEVERAGRRRLIRARLTEIPRSSGSELAAQLLGLTLAEQDPSSGRFALSGLKIAGIKPGSAAEEAGLRAGFYMVRINRRTVSDLEQVREVLSEVRSGDVVRVVVSALIEQDQYIVARRATVELLAQ